MEIIRLLWCALSQQQALCQEVMEVAVVSIMLEVSRFQSIPFISTITKRFQSIKSWKFQWSRKSKCPIQSKYQVISDFKLLPNHRLINIFHLVKIPYPVVIKQQIHAVPVHKYPVHSSEHVHHQSAGAHHGGEIEVKHQEISGKYKKYTKVWDMLKLKIISWNCCEAENYTNFN